MDYWIASKIQVDECPRLNYEFINTWKLVRLGTATLLYIHTIIHPSNNPSIRESLERQGFVPERVGRQQAKIDSRVGCLIDLIVIMFFLKHYCDV